MTKGCCSNCGGTGVDASAPETNGKCWDCYGTGHVHRQTRWELFKCGWSNFWSDFRREASGFFGNYMS